MTASTNKTMAFSLDRIAEADEHGKPTCHTPGNTRFVCLGVNMGGVRWFSCAVLHIFGRARS